MGKVLKRSTANNPLAHSALEIYQFNGELLIKSIYMREVEKKSPQIWPYFWSYTTLFYVLIQSFLNIHHTLTLNENITISTQKLLNFRICIYDILYIILCYYYLIEAPLTHNLIENSVHNLIYSCQQLIHIMLSLLYEYIPY